MIGTSREEIESGRVLENFEISEGIRFPEEVEIPENFENPATNYFAVLYSSLQNI